MVNYSNREDVIRLVGEKALVDIELNLKTHLTEHQRKNYAWKSNFIVGRDGKTYAVVVIFSNGVQSSAQEPDAYQVFERNFKKNEPRPEGTT